jgi:hypothetical protein
MRARALFGIIALFPAALNAAPAAAASHSLLVPVCMGDGQVHMVSVPSDGSPPDKDPAGCCAKGCHSGGSRKRATKNFEPSQ